MLAQVRMQYNGESFSEFRTLKGVLLPFGLKVTTIAMCWYAWSVKFLFCISQTYNMEKLLHCRINLGKTEARVVDWRIMIEKTFKRWN